MKTLIALILLFPSMVFAQGNTNRTIFSNPNNQFTGAFTGNGSSITNLGTNGNPALLAATNGRGFHLNLGVSSVLSDALIPSDLSSTILGGTANSNHASQSSIVNGNNNLIVSNTDYDFIGSGQGNQILDEGDASSIVGGVQNTITGPSANFEFIGGGTVNTIKVNDSGQGGDAIVAGNNNTIQIPGGGDFIGGGNNNLVSNGIVQAILGGQGNVAKAEGAQIVGNFVTNSTPYDVMFGYSNNAATLSPNGDLTLVGKITSKSFTSANMLVNTINVLNTAHGLGGTPSRVRCVLVCVTNDTATKYVVGDEIDVESIFNLSGNIQYGANSTNVFAFLSEAIAGTEGDYTWTPKGGGTGANPTSGNNWRLKVYAWP